MSTAPAAPLAGLSVAEQYLARVLPLIPADVRIHPGSKAFRLALREISERTGIMPSRRETARAIRALGARGQIQSPDTSSEPH